MASSQVSKLRDLVLCLGSSGISMVDPRALVFPRLTPTYLSVSRPSKPPCDTRHDEAPAALGSPGLRTLTRWGAALAAKINRAALCTPSADFQRRCRRAYAGLTSGSSGFQMLMWRVSGIRKRANTKHTAGTRIG